MNFQVYFPVNALRNIALKEAKTFYVFLSDADFIPMPDLHDIITRHVQNGNRLLDKQVTFHNYIM